MDIQWYPGHMAKAKRIMHETLPLIDVVIELLDARVPFSSKNPDIDVLAANKKRIIVLNKIDMADRNASKKWEEYFQNMGYKTAFVDSISGEGIESIYKKASELMSDKRERMKARGRVSAPIRVMVAGIPNVGKSAFINKIIGRKSAAVGNKPGVTKAKQWLKLRKNFELLDTPGILWHKFEDKDAGMKLALTGAIKSELLDKRELCHSLFEILERLYPNVLNKRYGIETLNTPPDEIIEQIARKRGHLLKGGDPDINRTQNMIIDEFRQCKLGLLTIETTATIKQT